MLIIIGLITVVASVLGGYVLAHGELMALWQPFEVLIIGGAAVGSFLVANPWHVIKESIKTVPYLFFGNPFNKPFYFDLLVVLERLFDKAKREGSMAIEDDIENPDESEIFSRYPAVLKEKPLVTFICDTLRIVTTGNMQPHDLEALMDEEIDTRLSSLEEPSEAIGTVADALPGFGIVAAVLGIVITMGMLGEGQEAIGQHVAAALVGTFLGIFLAYGFVGPLSKKMAHVANEEIRAFYCVKATIMGYMIGLPPTIAIEFGRKTLPDHERPSFSELEDVVRGSR